MDLGYVLVVDISRCVCWFPQSYYAGVHFVRYHFWKYEFLRPTYQPTTTIRRKSINGTLISLSMAIYGGLRVPFMKETVWSQTRKSILLGEYG